jgi:hypothetical protein
MYNYANMCTSIIIFTASLIVIGAAARTDGDLLEALLVLFSIRIIRCVFSHSTFFVDMEMARKLIGLISEGPLDI